VAEFRALTGGDHPAARRRAAAHIHHEHEETFYVVSGTPMFTCGTDTITAELGTLVTAPIGTPHTFTNPGDVPAIMLCTLTPDLYIDYFREA
jgi:mannose-6-phosphate isomerase-like protein (cupin superfamily)